MSAPGQDYSDALHAAGMSDAGVATWQNSYRASLQAAGMSDDGVNRYFGSAGPAFNPKPVQDTVTQNLSEKKTTTTTATPAATSPEPQNGGASGSWEPPPSVIHPAEVGLNNVKDAFENGWQMSVEGLNQRHAMPDRIPQENLPLAYSLAQKSGQFVGDLKSGVAGFLGGGLAGAELAAPAVVAPGIGEAVVGAGAAMGVWRELSHFLLHSVST